MNIQDLAKSVAALQINEDALPTTKVYANGTKITKQELMLGGGVVNLLYAELQYADQNGVLPCEGTIFIEGVPEKIKNELQELPRNSYAMLLALVTAAKTKAIKADNKKNTKVDETESKIPQ